MVEQDVKFGATAIPPKDSIAASLKYLEGVVSQLGAAAKAFIILIRRRGALSCGPLRSSGEPVLPKRFRKPQRSAHPTTIRSRGRVVVGSFHDDDRSPGCLRASESLFEFLAGASA